MKLNYTTRNGRMSVELEGDTQQAIWEQLGTFQEIFEEAACGKCGSENLRFVVREDKEQNKYYELHCLERDCRARLAFGSLKGKGAGLYPKRKDAEGKWKGSNGWVKYNKETGKEE